MLVKIVEIEL